MVAEPLPCPPLRRPPLSFSAPLSYTCFPPFCPLLLFGNCHVVTEQEGGRGVALLVFTRALLHHVLGRVSSTHTTAPCKNLSICTPTVSTPHTTNHTLLTESTNLHQHPTPLPLTSSHYRAQRCAIQLNMISPYPPPKRHTHAYTVVRQCCAPQTHKHTDPTPARETTHEY